MKNLKEQVEQKKSKALELAKQLKGKGITIDFYPTDLIDIQESCLNQ